jgi:hypothetical protein
MVFRRSFFANVPFGAQYTTANPGGAVRESIGVAVPEACVTVRDTETGFTWALICEHGLGIIKGTN